MAEPRDALERVVIQLEAVGESVAAAKVMAFLAELDKPEKAEPIKRTTRTVKTEED